MTLQKRTLKTDTCFSPYQSVNSFPGCLSHLQLIQDGWEDGAILSPVDLQRACAHDLDTILVQRDCQVVRNLASHWDDAAAACLEKTSTISAIGYLHHQWTTVQLVSPVPYWKCLTWLIFSFLPLMYNIIKLCHKETKGFSSDFPETDTLTSM